MNRIRYALLTALCAVFFISSNAQVKPVTKTVKKTFFYSFENVSSESQIETLKQNVSLLRGVTEVKSEYKADKGMGQIIVVVVEQQRSSEGDVLFDITDLKKAIIRNRLSPMELTQEESLIEN
ncbi:MAG TPA: hypothetical protein VF868_05875 [Bacteroidia bacterium]|jgi:nitrate reductase NapAB chaperone NapD